MDVITHPRAKLNSTAVWPSLKLRHCWVIIYIYMHNSVIWFWLFTHVQTSMLVFLMYLSKWERCSLFALQANTSIVSTTITIVSAWEGYIWQKGILSWATVGRNKLLLTFCSLGAPCRKEDSKEQCINVVGNDLSFLWTVIKLYMNGRSDIEITLRIQYWGSQSASISMTLSYKQYEGPKAECTNHIISDNFTHIGFYHLVD